MRLLQFGLYLLVASVAHSQSIVSVQNAASLGLGIPLSTIAPGSLVNLQMVRGGPVVISPDPATTLVRLRHLASGVETEVRPLRLSIGSVLIVLPPETPLGQTQVRLTVNGQEQLPAAVQVAPSAFGIFTKGQFGIGPANAQRTPPGGGTNSVQLTNPARVGDYLTLWGTGLGNATTGEVTVEIAGRSVTPSYAGPSSIAGLDQINVPLPGGTPPGCFVAVQVRVRDSISNVSTFPMSDAEGPCRDPFGFTAAELRTLDNGGSVRLAMASLRSEAMPAPGPPTELHYVRNEAAMLEFAKRDLERIALTAQPLLAEDAYYGCRLANTGAGALFQLVDDFDAGTIAVQGAGKSLALSNPGVPILYLNILPEKPREEPPFFTAGSWTLRVSGGRTVSPFEISRMVPPPLRWTNRDSITAVSRQQDLRVTWASDGYTEDDLITVTLSTPTNNVGRANAVTCRARASAGEAILPATLLSDLPPIAISSLELRLSPRPERRILFDVPLVTGAPENGAFEYLFTDTVRIPVR